MTFRTRPAILVVALAAATLVGCGGEPIQGESPKDQATSYAQSVRMQVTEFLQNSRANPKEAKGNASVLLEGLDYESREVGQYKEALAELHAKVTAVANASGDVTAALKEIELIAEKLPANGAAPASAK